VILPPWGHVNPLRRLSMFTYADIVDNDYIDMAFRCDMLVSWAISKIYRAAKSAG
jgi:hypothetical protein